MWVHEAIRKVMELDKNPRSTYPLSVPGSLLIHGTRPEIDVETILLGTIDHFEQELITFQDYGLTQGFPELTGLDILMLIVDDFPAGGVMGLEDYPNAHFLSAARENVSFPYSDLQANAHMGALNVQSIVEDCDGESSSVLANCLNHEVAHGLGAGHVRYFIDGQTVEATDRFLCFDTEGSKTFCRRNANLMRFYVETAAGLPIEERLALRQVLTFASNHAPYIEPDAI